LSKAKEIIYDWWKEYNEERPQKRLKGMTPKQYSDKFWEHYAINGASTSYLIQRFKGELSAQIIRRRMREARERSRHND